jgi:membrane-bound lytic murein transglycosylase D
LIAYNKWTKSGDVPDDRTYVVAVPVLNAGTVSMPVFASNDDKTVKPQPSSPAVKPQTEKKRINSVIAIKAVEGETAAALAQRAEINLSKFLKWNEMTSSQPLVAGAYYFLGKKRGRATENFHKVTAGEDLWQISQRYGVQLKRLQRFNRLGSTVAVPVGQTLYLASAKPKGEALDKIEEPVVVDNSETFNWTASPNGDGVKQDTVIIPATVVVQESQIQETSQVPKETQPTTVEIASGEIATTPAEEEIPSQETPVQVIAEPAADSQPISEPVPTVKKTEHVVQAKETLYSIAKLYNVGVMDLVQWNSLDLQQGLKIGQVLKLSDTEPVKNEVARVNSKEAVHEVKSSDTLYSIARQYGVTIKELMDWNEKKDFSLSVGEKLKIQQHQ